MEHHSLKERTLVAARNHSEEMAAITQDFEDRGILNSEMLAVCGLAVDLGVEVLIESGRWRGQSTEILAKYFEKKPVIVESIEVFRDENARYVEKKMAPWKNVRLRYGNAHWLVPQLTKRYRNKKIAILFDGPKGQDAIDAFRLALNYSPQVVAGFFHDMRKPTTEMPNKSREEMESSFGETFYTDDEDFVREFAFLDSGCEVALWRPYSIDSKPIGSYGPTIGLVLPSLDDYKKAKKDFFLLLLKSYRHIGILLLVKIYHFAKKVLGMKV